MSLPITCGAVSNAPTMAFAVTAVIEQNNKGKKSKLTESDIFCEKKGNGSGFEGNNVEI